MKSSFIILLMLVTATCFSQDKWLQKTNFPAGNRYASFYFSLDSKIYVGTGYAETGYQKDFWEYDPTDNVWTQKADFGGGIRGFGVGFSIGDKGYAGTGLSGYYLWNKDIWEYDTTSNRWTQKADFSGGLRAASISFTINNKAYVGTGYYQPDPSVNSTFLNDIWEYDPISDSWTKKADMPEEGRANAGSISIGNKGYIGFGDNNNISKNDFWEYDPSSDSWTRKTDLPAVKRSGPEMFSIGNKGYVVSGWAGYPLNDTWEFDPAANSWTRKTDFPAEGRSQGIGLSVGNKGYVGLGSSTVSYNDLWEYIPVCTFPVTIPSVYAVQPGGDSNTIYIGYGPSSLTLQANVPDGQQGTYNYLWSTGATSSSIVVNPSVPGIYVYSVTISDNQGCTGADSIIISVVDVRCGNNNDKVKICRVPKGNPGKSKTLCIYSFDVSDHLNNGSYLGDCGDGSVSKVKSGVVDEVQSNTNLAVYPNPNNGVFVVQINNYPGGNGSIEIINQSGRIINKKNINLSKGNQVIYFEITAVDGVYLLKLTNNNKVLSTRFFMK